LLSGGLYDFPIISHRKFARSAGFLSSGAIFPFALAISLAS
jgi:hypothetical protein